jgi:hypothetical protein
MYKYIATLLRICINTIYDRIFNMIISHDLKFIFIHVHRTAGTTLTNLLRKKLVGNFEVFPQHSNARTSESIELIRYNEYYTFGFTRNPWERLLSWYTLIYYNDQISLAEERVRFEQFIEMDAASDFTKQEFHYNTLDYFTTKNGEFIANKIASYEYLENEMGALLQRFNLTPLDIPLLNNTRKKKLQRLLHR